MKLRRWLMAATMAAACAPGSEASPHVRATLSGTVQSVNGSSMTFPSVSSGMSVVYTYEYRTDVPGVPEAFTGGAGVQYIGAIVRARLTVGSVSTSALDPAVNPGFNGLIIVRNDFSPDTSVASDQLLIRTEWMPTGERLVFTVDGSASAVPPQTPGVFTSTTIPGVGFNPMAFGNELSMGLWRATPPSNPTTESRVFLARAASFTSMLVCGAADVAGLGGTLGPDGLLSSDDVIVFLSEFFSGDAAVADIASLGGGLTPDGRLTADDVVAFLGAFFAGC